MYILCLKHKWFNVFINTTYNLLYNYNFIMSWYVYDIVFKSQVLKYNSQNNEFYYNENKKNYVVKLIKSLS